MLTICKADGHFYIHTLHTTSKHCAHCGARRWPWSRESFASLRGLVALRRLQNGTDVTQA
jgi:hypothetical protein